MKLKIFTVTFQMCNHFWFSWWSESKQNPKFQTTHIPISFPRKYSYVWSPMYGILQQSNKPCLSEVVNPPHDDVIKWKHFPRYWPFVRGIHRWPVNSPHKGQWRGALMFSLICAGINGWVNNGEAGDFRRRCAHYDVTLMSFDDSGGFVCSQR